MNSNNLIKTFLIVALVYTIGCEVSSNSEKGRVLIKSLKDSSINLSNKRIVNNKKRSYHYYTAQFNKNNILHINMNISSNNSISGNYFIDKKAINYNLIGKTKNNDIILYNPDSSLLFKGKIDNIKKIKGIWYNKSKKYDITLNEDYSNSIAFTDYSFYKKYHLFNNKKYPSCLIEYKYYHPSNSDNINLIKLLETSFFGKNYKLNKPEENCKEYINNLLKEYKGLEEDFDTTMPYYVYNWEYLTDYNIFFNNHNILCFQVKFFSYTGGAHGYGGNQYYVFDTKKFTELKLEDLFLPENKPKIKKLLMKKIKEVLLVKTDEELAEIIFDVNNVELTENFYINNAGIGFVFLPYEIAPYSMGTIEVFFNFDEIKNLLLLNSSLRKLL